jgi:hypothetical protein
LTVLPACPARLSSYFYGSDVTWRGALVGAWWSFAAAFVAGWFVAFVHNFVLATGCCCFEQRPTWPGRPTFSSTFDVDTARHGRLTRQEDRTLCLALARASQQGWGIAIGLLSAWNCC